MHSKPIPLIDRREHDHFVERIEHTDGCWNWQGTIATNGYGRVRLGGREYPAHRVAFTLWRGPIPVGLVIDHLCRNRACVRPEHLEAVTQQENIARSPRVSERAARTHCRNGHLMDAENTMSERGYPRCRACARRSARESMQRRRQAAASA